MAGEDLSLTALRSIPLVQSGDDLGAIIDQALQAVRVVLADGDVIVVAQKIVSKVEGRSVSLATVTPSAKAEALAKIVNKDPRLVQLILDESEEVMRAKPGVLIVRHKLGLVLANAGIDQSNIDHVAGEQALLLPIDPDASAGAIAAKLMKRHQAKIGVLIIDSLGRAWRTGTVGVAIGVANMPGLVNLRGKPDIFGRALQTSETAFADEIGAAASLVMGQADERRPVVLVRGLTFKFRAASANELIRPQHMDLFP